MVRVRTSMSNASPKLFDMKAIRVPSGDHDARSPNQVRCVMFGGRGSSGLPTFGGACAPVVAAASPPSSRVSPTAELYWNPICAEYRVRPHEPADLEFAAAAILTVLLNRTHMSRITAASAAMTRTATAPAVEADDRRHLIAYEVIASPATGLRYRVGRLLGKG